MLSTRSIGVGCGQRYAISKPTRICMLACSRCWRDAGGALRLRVSAHWRRNPCATHNGRTHDGPIPFRRRPARHPRQRRARRRHPAAAPGERQRQRVRAQRQRRREPQGERHQPLHRAHGVQGHDRAQLPADQPRRRAARRRRQRPHRQGPHRLPHARHGEGRRRASCACSATSSRTRAFPRPSSSASGRCCCRSTSRTRKTRSRPRSSCSTSSASPATPPACR